MILERRPNDFPGRNMLLQITLGLLSAGRDLDDLLARYAPPRAPAGGDPTDDDEGALFMLGLIAFARRLQAAVAAVPAPPPVADPPAPPPPLEGLLR